MAELWLDKKDLDKHGKEYLEAGNASQDEKNSIYVIDGDVHIEIMNFEDGGLVLDFSVGEHSFYGRVPLSNEIQMEIVEDMLDLINKSREALQVLTK